MTAAVLTFLAVLLALPRAPTTPARPGRSTTRATPGQSTVLPLTTGAAAAVAVGLLFGGAVGPVLGAFAGAVAFGAVRRMEPPAARRRREALADGLSHAVDLMASCLAAGRAPGDAVDEVAAAVHEPMNEELAAVAARLRLGMDPTSVWREVAAHPQLGPWGRCMLRATDSGASVAEAMTRLAEDLRRDTRAAMEARARAVGADRASRR